MIDINKQRQCNHPKGEVSHHQIIHFMGGEKLLIQNVTYIWEKEMVHIVDAVGVEYVINKNNVLYYERVAKNKEEKSEDSTKRSKRGRTRKAKKVRLQKGS